MARGNMIVTLVANTKRFSAGLKRAGGDILTFGNVAKAGMGLAVAGIGMAATAIISFVPNLVKMAEESRKSERRLENIAGQMGVFGENTKIVTDRLSKYAEEMSFLTGVDDELIRNSESILLTFKNVAKSADDMGGVFDRATQATIDLAAAGFGEAESNAKLLGKALQDPVKGLTRLSRAGVTFTKSEEKKIKRLAESGKLLEAQKIILGAIETQVGGTAEATASATDKMAARWENMQETLGTALLPAVDSISTAMGEWLDSIEGKRAVKELTDELVAFGEWMASPDGEQAVRDFLVVMKETAKAIIGTAKAVKWLIDLLTGPNWKKAMKNAGASDAWNLSGQGSSSGSGTGPLWSQNSATNKAQAPQVNVSVKGIAPTAVVGREVLNAIKNARKIGIR